MSIRNSKEAAVQQWESALEELPDEYSDRLEELDIHDNEDRMEIGEIIHVEMGVDELEIIEDAWHDLKVAFGY